MFLIPTSLAAEQSRKKVEYIHYPQRKEEEDHEDTVGKFKNTKREKEKQSTTEDKKEKFPFKHPSVWVQRLCFYVSF